MKKYLNLLVIALVVFLVSACGANNMGKGKTIKVDDDMSINYKLDVPYYGNIKVGKSTFDMLSTNDMLREKGIESVYTRIAGYQVKGTSDYFYYKTIKYDDAYEAEFVAHSDFYLKNGCEDCDEQLVSSIELPKGITFNSTIQDVTKAYGEASEKNEYDDNTYQWSKKENGEKFGGVKSDNLTYIYETDKEQMRLELCFSKSTGKLHKVKYNIQVKE